MMAQNEYFNLTDLFTNGNLYPQRMNQWQWIPQSGDFVYVKGNSLIRHTASSGKESELVSLDAVNRAMKADGKDAFRRFPTIAHWVSPTRLYLRVRDGYVLYDLQEERMLHTLKTTVADASNLLVDWQHARFSYTIGDHLFVCRAGGEPVRVDKDGAKDVRYGHMPHRNEFGIEQGAFWSPGGNYLAFYRMDESMVTDYPLVDA
ncbi:MAG: DPP IV N-terminal domain-containing protein, partial [Bacteroidales bacterium]|nr:DPP IV N-terminal domain-containing protein [Bacteroidales bacterium]